MYGCMAVGTVTACQLFPCDVNSRGCSLLVAGSVRQADRVCGACRNGFQGDGVSCVDVRLVDLSQQTVASGNANAFMTDIAASAVNRNQSATTLLTLASSLTKITDVSSHIIRVVLVFTFRSDGVCVWSGQALTINCTVS